MSLGDRIELAYGKALRDEDREPGGIDVYGSNGRVGTHNVPLVKGPGILVGRKGTVGAVHFAERSFWPIDTVYYVESRCDDDIRYLHHLLDYLPLRLLNAATGVPGLSRRDAYALRGAFPPTPEQTVIADILNGADAALDRIRVAVEKACEVRRALAQRLFSEGIRGEARKKTAIGMIPKSWNVQPVSSVVNSFQYGLSVPMQTKGLLPILRMGDIQDGDVQLQDLKYITLPTKLTAPYIVKHGDVLFNRTNSQEWVGKVGIYRHDVDVVFASYLIRLFPDAAQVDNYYLGHILNSYSAQCRIKRYATPGVQQVNINATNLGKVMIPIPSGPHGLDEQRGIATILEKADAVVRNYQPVLDAQHALKASLMQDLLTGKVRVSNGTKVAAA